MNDTVEGSPRNFGEVVAIKIHPTTGLRDPFKHSCVDEFSSEPTSPCDNWLKFCRGVYDDTANGVDDIAAHGGTCSNLDRGGMDASTSGTDVVVWES